MTKTDSALMGLIYLMFNSSLIILWDTNVIGYEKVIVT